MSIALLRELRKKKNFTNLKVLLQTETTYGFISYSNNITTAEFLALQNYLSLFGFGLKKLPVSKANFLTKNNLNLKGNLFIIYTNNVQNLLRFPIISFYTYNKMRMPIFSVKFKSNIFSTLFFYKNVKKLVGPLSKNPNAVFVSKLFLIFNTQVKVFKLLHALFLKKLV